MSGAIRAIMGNIANLIRSQEKEFSQSPNMATMPCKEYCDKTVQQRTDKAAQECMEACRAFQDVYSRYSK
jgi:hypothetical protein